MYYLKESSCFNVVATNIIMLIWRHNRQSSRNYLDISWKKMLPTTQDNDSHQRVHIRNFLFAGAAPSVVLGSVVN